MKSPKTGIRGQSFLKKSVISIPVFFTNIAVRDLAINSLPENFSNVFIKHSWSVYMWTSYRSAS